MIKRINTDWPKYFLVLWLGVLIAVSTTPKLAYAAGCAVIHVPGDHATIQAALNAAVSGDTVMVAAGDYNENIVLKDGVALIGAGADNTKIIAHDDVVAGADNSLIEGFTIANDGSGMSWGYRGYGHVGTIRHNIFIGHYVGIHCGQSSRGTIINNVIADNDSGVAFGWDGKPYILNNIIVNGTWHGLYWYNDGLGSYTPQATIRYNDVWNNSNNYEAPIAPGIGDISVDPKFVDAAAGDYHLQSSSPCIDAADPTSPLDPDGTIADMGAFYYHHTNAIIRRVPDEYPTIQDAIDAATSGDTVMVAPGIYSENVTMKAGIALVGSGARVTVIDAGGSGDVIDADAANCVIRGFTITNGGDEDAGPPAHIGCGVYCDDNSPVIAENVIVGNRFGIGCWNGSSPDIRNNVIKNNRVDGIYVYEANPNIINNTIVGNARAGTLLRENASPNIINNIVMDNLEGIDYNYVSGSPVEKYNDVWRNGTDYVDTSAGTGDISENPQFVDASSGNYHLKATSPCIDAGAPDSMLDPDGTTADMGAFYFQQTCDAIEYGTLYFTDAHEQPGSIYKLLNGAETSVYTRVSGRLYHLAFAPDGTLYFSNANDYDLYALIGGNEVLVYTHDTWLRDVAFDSHGNLFFSEATGAGADGKIYRLVGGVATLFYTVELSDVGYWGGDFTFNEHDTLYLSNGNLAGANLYKVVGGVPQVVYSAPGAECIAGLTFGNSGELYYASWNGGNIYKLDTSSVPFTRTLVYSNPAHTWLADVTLVPVPAPPTQIKSVWADVPLTIDGTVEPDWADAAEIPLPHSAIYVKNDAENLYLLVDLTEDTHDDTLGEPSGDFFHLSFDVDKDEMITLNVDLDYRLSPTNDLALAYYLGPGAWTGLFETASSLGVGFGGSMNSATPHRIWEFAIPLEEIDSSLTDLFVTPEPVRFGIEVHSQTPFFHSLLPPNFKSNFANLSEIFLAFSPAPTLPVFISVGAIPSTEITDGYATTVPGYVPYVVDAPFGGYLRIFGNFDYLRGQGAKYYQVWYTKDGTSAPLQQSWTNYRWEINKFVPHKISPDEYDRYEIPPASEIWVLDNLLILWRTYGFPDGKYTLHLEAYTAGGALVPLPANQNQLVLVIDNKKPHVEIIAVTHDSDSVGRCDIVYLDETDQQDGLRFEITAWDDKVNDTYPPKHLYSYSLVAHYGDNETDPIHSDNYSNHENENGPNLWGGVQNLIIPAVAQNPWRPPEPCAYQFRLSAWSRTIDGYHRTRHSEYNKHVTILFGESSCNPGDASGDGDITAYDAALILQFVVGLISELPPPAQSPTGVPQHNYSVTIPELTARAGNRIQVPIAINDTTGLTAGGIVIKYDQSVLKAVDFTASSLLNGSYWKANIERAGEVRFAFATAEKAKGTGNLLMVEFEVLPNTAGTTSSLVFDTVNLVNSLTITKLDGSVTVLPEHTDLLSNFPNPFNPETWIPYQLAQDAPVVIRIYNQKGQIVRAIDLGQQPAGSYVTKGKAGYWDGTSNFGDRVASGVYFYTLHAGKFTATRKMVILK